MVTRRNVSNTSGVCPPILPFSPEMTINDNHAAEPNEPSWDAGDPDGSISAYAEYLHGKARAMFLHDKFHTELIFLFTAEELAGMGHVQGDRDLFLAQLKTVIREKGIFGVVHIVESWSYFGRQPNDHTLKQIMMGEIRVSELKDEDKTEALVVVAQSQSGWSRTWIDPILRDKKAGTVTLGESASFDGAAGRFGQLFDPS